jgi:alpha-glucuronidase
MLVGGLPTADPLDAQVVAWWSGAAAAAVSAVPGFGGFVVKADSEHEVGPSVYNRTAPQGANMLAGAVGQHGGLLVWRSFTHPGQWDNHTGQCDQARYLFDLFTGLDGQWADNVVLQTKTGPVRSAQREAPGPTP